MDNIFLKHLLQFETKIYFYFFYLRITYGWHHQLKKKSMERPMDGIINININPMSSIPGKTIQYFFSMDGFDKGYNYPQSSIGFDEIKNSWNSRVFHTRGSTKTGTAHYHGNRFCIRPTSRFQCSSRPKTHLHAKFVKIGPVEAEIQRYLH